MKRERRISRLVWIPLCALAALIPGIALPDAEEPIEATLEGEISVSEWDDDGKIRSIYISDGEFGDCLVAKGRHWESLTGHIGKTVRLTGVVSETEEDGFWYVIDVSTFSVTSSEDEEYPPDHDFEEPDPGSEEESRR
jgi:hypothetical protein